jgi:hypothetical protein
VASEQSVDVHAPAAPFSQPHWMRFRGTQEPWKQLPLQHSVSVVHCDSSGMQSVQVPLRQVPLQHSPLQHSPSRVQGSPSGLQGSHAFKMQNPVQQSSSVSHPPCGPEQQIPPLHTSPQHCWSKSQLVPLGRHPGVVEVVLVDVEVVGVVVVVVVCAWQLPPEQLPLQHCSFLTQFFPLRLHPGGSADASPMPTDPNALPTTAAPISLRALPRVMEPSASPLARSSKKPSSLAIGCPFPEE